MKSGKRRVLAVTVALALISCNVIEPAKTTPLSLPENSAIEFGEDDKGRVKRKDKKGYFI